MRKRSPLAWTQTGKRWRDVFVMFIAEEKNPFNVHTAHKRAFSLREHFVRPKKASTNNMNVQMSLLWDNKRFHALSEAVRVNYLQKDNDYYQDNPNNEVERRQWQNQTRCLIYLQSTVQEGRRAGFSEWQDVKLKFSKFC